MPSGIYKQFDIIIVPFPFSDMAASKRRPALLLTSESFIQATGHGILAMITSSRSIWSCDVAITDIASAGLKTPCAVRMKLFTLDAQLFLRRAGTLAKKDQAEIKKNLKKVMPL